MVHACVGMMQNYTRWCSPKPYRLQYFQQYIDEQLIQDLSVFTNQHMHTATSTQHQKRSRGRGGWYVHVCKGIVFVTDAACKVEIAIRREWKQEKDKDINKILK